MSAEETPGPSLRGLWRTSFLYFAMVFAVGLALGPVRVLWLEPWLGPLLAILCELPFLLAAMYFAAGAAQRLGGFGGGPVGRLLVGLVALGLQQLADLAVGFGLRGMTLAEQLSYFTTPPGFLYAAALAVFALMPLAAHRRSAAPNDSAS